MEKNYGIDLLVAKYHVLKEKVMQAEEEMAFNPNEYADNAIIHGRKKMEEIKQCLIVLNIPTF